MMVSKGEDGRGELGVVEADCSSTRERERAELVDTEEQIEMREYLAMKKLEPCQKKAMENCLSQGNVPHKKSHAERYTQVKRRIKAAVSFMTITVSKKYARLGLKVKLVTEIRPNK